ncbi:MAG TPA: hypothetical protein PJ992_05780 [Arachnia sp.]|nr:hypothetical protein [Arachnia sp.]
MIQVALDTHVSDVDAVVLVAGDDVLVVDAPTPRRAMDGEVLVRQWRNSGPFPRHRGRTVPTYATLASLGVAQELIAERAFLVDGVRWRGLLAPALWLEGREWGVAEFVAALPPLPDPRREAQGRVAEVRAIYGRMLADVAYRIENAALFDSAVETTRRFETALALWADVTPSTADDEVRRRAALVELAFETARAHAETVGLAHLPQQARDHARRAAGAARLARAAATEAERAAAQDQVVRILRSLALYYLPDPDRLPLALTRGPATPRPAA